MLEGSKSPEAAGDNERHTGIASHHSRAVDLTPLCDDGAQQAQRLDVLCIWRQLGDNGKRSSGAILRRMAGHAHQQFHRGRTPPKLARAKAVHFTHTTKPARRRATTPHLRRLQVIQTPVHVRGGQEHRGHNDVVLAVVADGQCHQRLRKRTKESKGKGGRGPRTINAT